MPGRPARDFMFELPDAGARSTQELNLVKNVAIISVAHLGCPLLNDVLRIGLAQN